VLPARTLLEVVDHCIASVAFGHKHVGREEEVTHAVSEANPAAKRDGGEKWVHLHDHPDLFRLFPAGVLPRGAEPAGAHVRVQLLHGEVLLL